MSYFEGEGDDSSFKGAWKRLIEEAAYVMVYSDRNLSL